ncbi:DNA polymerase III subunit delta' [Paracoccus sphaerophysae]|uniref:DNA polymerase III subunit delta n=1 Tax=Paracoccus sphaerophysae TaxID=690417 RepID=A0A099FHF9_9RHOB|nr:DNA polymerase III subunit delta' [Paracoccus sphaerophysae]KGJ09691.1 DNA polymerase III subunit delta' [Paracoccus sphaerophysae]
MSAAETDPPVESDRVPGAPHPRETPRVIGQDAAIGSFMAAADSGRLPHGWLITGPRGTGKATLAWAIARWLIAGEGGGLDLPPDHPVARRMRALAEPRLHLVRRSVDDKTGRLRAEIVVDDIRRLLSFFHLSAAEGGRRVAIIDAADDMNTAAANAVLKMLEEPPRDAVLLLIAHQPARLLPTIRSRCRELRLAPLSPDDMAAALAPLDAPGDPARLAALAGGSVGEALRLAGQDGLDRYADLVALFATLPRMDRLRAAALADAAAGRPGPDGDPFDLTMTLLDRLLTRAARTGLMGPPLPEAAPGEAELLTRLSPDEAAARHWAAAQAELSARARRGRAVNLDPAALVMDMLLTLAQGPGAPDARD